MQPKHPTHQEILRYNLELAGTEPTFFAQYQSDTIARLLFPLTTKPISIVDVGCSDGLLTSFIAAHFYYADVHGVDISAEHIEVARMAYPSIAFSVNDNALSAFSDSSVDLVIMADTLHHIPAHEQQIMLASIMRILKPGGFCVILEPNPYNFYARYRFACNPTEKSLPSSAHPGVQLGELRRTSRMISPLKLSHSLKQYGSTRTLFYHFFPQKLHKLRPYEQYLSWMPFGQLYACIIKKK